ncbi:MAG: LLM class flavin-dependent oxidoreductase [Gammaproteobacteria bacterium]
MDKLSYGFLCAEPRRSHVVALEALGIDSLWAAGHVASGRPDPEAVVVLSHLAALTSRVIVGTAVLLLPLYPPAIVAKQFMELDRLSGGRIVLGIGVGGEYPSEFRALQVPITERGPRTDEAIDLIRRWWAGGPVDFNGRFWQIEQVSIDPAPVHAGGPPIVVAGRKPPAMRRAALRGDGWMPFLFSPERYAESAAVIRDTAAAAGRSLAGFQWMCFVYTSIDDDPALARERALNFIGGAQAGDGGRFAQLLDRVAAVGTPAQVGARLQAFVDAGVRHFVFAPCERTDVLGAARRLMHDVVPTLRLP